MLSFGPFGKRDLLLRRGGCLDVSKPNVTQVNRHQQNVFQTHLNQHVHKFGSRYGDGSKSIVLARDVLFQSVGAGAETHQNPRRRIEMLRSTTALRSTFQQLKNTIVSHMLHASAWCIVGDFKTRLKTLCRCAVLPASNDYYADLTSQLLVDWIFADATEVITLERCRYALEQFQVVVHSLPPSPRNILSNKKFEAVPADCALVCGVCKDYIPLSVPDKHTPILLLRSWSPPLHGDHQPTMLQSGNTFAASPLQSEAYVAAICAELEQATRLLILCADKGLESDQNTATGSHSNIFVMERVPSEHLEYLAQRSGSTIYDTLTDAALAVSRNTLQLASCSHLDRTVLEEQKILHYVICGLKGPGRQSVNPTSAMPPQLLLYPNSSMEGRTMIDLIRRSLRVVISSLGEGSEYAGERRAEADVRQNAVVVPGGGAAELSWSALFRELASDLRRFNLAFSTGSPGNDVAGSCDTPWLPALAVEISTALRCRLLPRLWPSCAELCDAIAVSYEAVPLQLIVNADGLISAAGATSPPRVLLEWKSRILDGVSAGRLGAVVNPDLGSEDIYHLGDAIEGGVWTSFHQFWDGFMEILDQLELYLRVDGDNGVIRVRKAVQANSGTIASDEE